MALLITKDFSTMGGIDLTQLYIRFFFSISFDGKTIDVNTENFLSREAYLEGLSTNKLPIQGIPEHFKFAYDRAIDGTDLLTFVHNKVKDYLIVDKTADIPLLDPSTGMAQYDPSTGELLTETVIDIPKFAEDLEITFVDIT